jgi:hypothetical protein
MRHVIVQRVEPFLCITPITRAFLASSMTGTDTDTSQVAATDGGCNVPVALRGRLY